jgi:uncharacterized protein
MAAQHPQAFGRLLCAADFFVGPVKELAVIGETSDERTRALLAPAREKYRPNLVVMCAPAAVEGYPLLEARETLDGAPTAYVCENFACRQPVTDPGAVGTFLSS